MTNYEKWKAEQPAIERLLEALLSRYIKSLAWEMEQERRNL